MYPDVPDGRVCAGRLRTSHLAPHYHAAILSRPNDRDTHTRAYLRTSTRPSHLGTLANSAANGDSTTIGDYCVIQAASDTLAE